MEKNVYFLSVQISMCIIHSYKFKHTLYDRILKQILLKLIELRKRMREKREYDYCFVCIDMYVYFKYGSVCAYYVAESFL